MIDEKLKKALKAQFSKNTAVHETFRNDLVPKTLPAHLTKHLQVNDFSKERVEPTQLKGGEADLSEKLKRIKGGFLK